MYHPQANVLQKVKSVSSSGWKVRGEKVWVEKQERNSSNPKVTSFGKGTERCFGLYLPEGGYKKTKEAEGHVRLQKGGKHLLCNPTTATITSAEGERMSMRGKDAVVVKM